MMIGKIKSNIILSICVKKFHRAREHVEDIGPWALRRGVPPSNLIRDSPG